MSNYQVLILDLDGTTIASSGDALPSDRVVDAVKKAKSKVQVSLATGRPYHLSLSVIKALDLDGPGVFNGGAEIIDVVSGKILKQQFLSKGAMRELVKLSLPFGYKVYTDKDQYTKPIISPDEIKDSAAKLFIEGIKTNDAINILEELSAVNEASALPTSSWQGPDVVDIHITHINATKRHGVEHLIKMLGTDKQKVIAIGDSHNDIPLLQAAGFKVAMGNAPDEVKAVADHIAPSQENDGVADTIDRFILS